MAPCYTFTRKELDILIAAVRHLQENPETEYNQVLIDAHGDAPEPRELDLLVRKLYMRVR